MILPIIIISIMWFYSIFYRIKYSVHMMQIETYDNEKYIKWLRKNKLRVLTQKSRIFIGISAVMTLISFLFSFNVYIHVVLWSAFSFYFIEFKKYDVKKPLVLTERAKRLIETTIILSLIDLVIVIALCRLVAGDAYFVQITSVVLSLSIYYGTYYVIGGVWVVEPIEKAINMKFYVKAQDKIKSMEDLTTVGITGSYGKTSTKYIATKILEQRYKTYKTPESYNTPMGISKAINNELDESYDVFVAELGAVKLGEIKEVAKLVRPKIGIITSIGPSHLETFKSIENIMKTKYELIEELPAEGQAIFNYDNEYVKKLADMTYTKKILYGLKNSKEVDIYADNITINSEGSTFTLHIKEKGSVECKTRLLGRHNILNILAGAAAGYALGMTLIQIACGIEKIEAIEHRLQLINPGTGVLVIDDAFNSNPDGASAALEVLAEFQNKRKIIVTPGMIELAEIEYSENKKFGLKIGKTCDFAILVGPDRTKAIYEGIMESEFKRENIFVVKSLKESEEVLKKLLRAGDVVLFENDLPDTYNEEE